MKTTLALGLTALSSPLAASFYPPDYVISESCQHLDQVTVCALNRNYGHYPRLRIVYEGLLMKEHWSHISVFVQLNGQSHVFRMNNSRYQESITLGGPAAVRICKAGTPTGEDESQLPPSSRTCEHTTEPAGSIVWEADPIPAEQNALFLYAYDGYRVNAWDVQLAFVSDDGQWDSLLGQNYSFRFE